MKNKNRIFFFFFFSKVYLPPVKNTITIRLSVGSIETSDRIILLKNNNNKYFALDKCRVTNEVSRYSTVNSRTRKIT